jgi:hypothetical protein
MDPAVAEKSSAGRTFLSTASSQNRSMSYLPAVLQLGT